MANHLKKDNSDKISTSTKTKSFFAGFKAFLTRGNIIDMAIGVVIGTAFGAIVTALVNNIILPPIAYAIGGESFENLRWILRPEQLDPATNAVIVNEIAIGYGILIQNILQFIIIAFTIYTIVTLVLRRKKFEQQVAAQEAAKNAVPVTPVIPPDIELLTEIRDLLKTQQTSKLENKQSPE